MDLVMILIKYSENGCKYESEMTKLTTKQTVQYSLNKY